MVIVYVLYMIQPVTGNYSLAYIILYKSAVHFADMIPFVLLTVFSFRQKTDKHRYSRSILSDLLLAKLSIDSIANLLFLFKIVKNLTFIMLAEDLAFLMLIPELILIAVASIFPQQVFVVINNLFLVILLIFSYDVLRYDQTPLRIIWGIANYVWYLSLIPLAETLTIGNTFSKTYLRIVNYFRIKKGLDIIEPENTVNEDELLEDDYEESIDTDFDETVDVDVPDTSDSQ